MKASHKFKSVRDAAGVVGSASSMAEAAKKLGVNRSTLHRWIIAGKVPAIGSALVRGAAPAIEDRAAGEWAAAVKAEHADLTSTDLQLVDLADAALLLAKTEGSAMTRLSAMGRFQALVKQLRLSDEAIGEKPDKPRRPAAMTARCSPADDPRRKHLMLQ